MKHLTLAFISVIYLTSCTNGSHKQQESATTNEPVKTSSIAGRLPQGDPVCEMPRESSWTEHTIYNNDTIWFCSEGCKKAFEARPAKYLKTTH